MMRVHGHRPATLSHPDNALAAVPRRRLWPRLAYRVLRRADLTVGVAAAALYAYDASHEGRVLTGVSVSGVDLSGLIRDQAVAALTAAFAGYGEGQVVVKTTAQDVAVPYEAFSRQADIDAMIDEAMLVGRDGSMADRAVAELRLALSGYAISPRVMLDAEALTDKIKRAASQFDRPAVDSRIVRGVNSLYTMPGRSGRTFDGTEAAASALAVLSQPDAPAEVMVEATETEIPPVYDDAEANATIAMADQMVGDLKVAFGDTMWTIRENRVRSWITFQADATGAIVPTLDEAKIRPS